MKNITTLNFLDVYFIVLGKICYVVLLLWDPFINHLSSTFDSRHLNIMGGGYCLDPGPPEPSCTGSVP